MRLGLVLYKRDRIARVRILSIPLDFDEGRAFGGDVELVDTGVSERDSALYELVT